MQKCTKTVVFVGFFVFVVTLAAAGAATKHFIDGSTYRQMNTGFQGAYVTGVFDAFNYVAVVNPGVFNWPRVAGCLNRFSNLGAAKNWLDARVPGYPRDFTPAGVIALEAYK